MASDVADVVHEFSTLRPDHMLNISEVRCGSVCLYSFDLFLLADVLFSRRRAPCHIGTPACVSGCKIKSGVVREVRQLCFADH